jgi:Flp pilus assembly protein TadG
MLLLAIAEVGLVNIAAFSLEHGAAEGARLIRTGQVQTQNLSATQFKTQMCKFIGPPVDCSKVQVDVRKFANFGSSELTGANPDGTVNTHFDPGVGGDVVIVRTFYVWDIMAALPGYIALSNMSGGKRMITATVAFRNEPFKPPQPQ